MNEPPHVILNKILVIMIRKLKSNLKVCLLLWIWKFSYGCVELWEWLSEQSCQLFRINAFAINVFWSWNVGFCFGTNTFLEEMCYNDNVGDGDHQQNDASREVWQLLFSCLIILYCIHWCCSELIFAEPIVYWRKVSFYLCSCIFVLAQLCTLRVLLLQLLQLISLYCNSSSCTNKSILVSLFNLTVCAGALLCSCAKLDTPPCRYYCDNSIVIDILVLLKLFLLVQTVSLFVILLLHCCALVSS